MNEVKPGDATLRHAVAWMRATFPDDRHAQGWAAELDHVFLGGPPRPQPDGFTVSVAWDEFDRVRRERDAARDEVLRLVTAGVAVPEEKPGRGLSAPDGHTAPAEPETPGEGTDVGDLVEVLGGLRKGAIGIVESRVPGETLIYSVLLRDDERPYLYRPGDLRVVERRQRAAPCASPAVAAETCPDCDQPMLPAGEVKRPNEYDHASGCPRGEDSARPGEVGTHTLTPLQIAVARAEGRMRVTARGLGFVTGEPIGRGFSEKPRHTPAVEPEQPRSGEAIPGVNPPGRDRDLARRIIAQARAAHDVLDFGLGLEAKIMAVLAEQRSEAAQPVLAEDARMLADVRAIMWDWINKDLRDPDTAWGSFKAIEGVLDKSATIDIPTPRSADAPAVDPRVEAFRDATEIASAWDIDDLHCSARHVARGIVGQLKWATGEALRAGRGRERAQAPWCKGCRQQRTTTSDGYCINCGTNDEPKPEEEETTHGTVEHLDSRHGLAPQQGEPDRREPAGGEHGAAAEGRRAHGDEGDDHVRRRGRPDEPGELRGRGEALGSERGLGDAPSAAGSARPAAGPKASAALVGRIELRLREHARDLASDHPDSPPMRDKAEAFLDAADMVASFATEKTS